MAAQLLFYEAAVPLSATRHGAWAIEPGGYAFSKAANSVPLTTVEFAPAAAEYAIVFAGEPGALVPVVVLGVRSDNLFVDDQGGWDARYLPAFVRRYPFVFSSNDQGKTFTLCIDEGFAGFNQQGRGQPLFGEEKKPSGYTQNVLKFLQQYQAEFRRTQAFCRKLEELQLLAPMQAQFGEQAGERILFAGFSAVDRDKLRALPRETIAELLKSDELELVYLHLQSLRNFPRLRLRMEERRAAPPPADAPPADAQATPAPTAKAGKTPAGKGRKKQEGKLTA